MNLSVLAHVDVILGFAILILTIFSKFEVPPILGFLVTGILIGPHWLGIMDSGQNMELNAELSIVFLLFTIGVDLSLKELWNMKKAALAGGLSRSFLQQHLHSLAVQGLGLVRLHLYL